MAKYVHYPKPSMGPIDWSVQDGSFDGAIAEERADFGGKDILYIVKRSSEGFYLVVPGEIVSWQSEKNKKNMPVSEINPITDPELQERVRLAFQELKASGKFGEEVEIIFWEDADQVADW